MFSLPFKVFVTCILLCWVFGLVWTHGPENIQRYGAAGVIVSALGILGSLLVAVWTA